MNKFIKILQSIGLAIITLLIMGAFIGLSSIILLPFLVILNVGLSILMDILGEWIILGFAIGVVIIYFAQEIYKNI